MKPTLRRSEIQALLSCSAYVGDESEAAAFGTLVHRLIADPANVAEILAELCGVGPERFDEARGLLGRFLATHELADDAMVESTLRIETAHAFVEGTPDRVEFLSATEAVVLDWKTGWAVSDASFQMKFYGAMLAVTQPELLTVYARADFIRLTDGVVECQWPTSELRAWWEYDIVAALPGILERRENPTPTGGSACQYCRKRLTCALSVAPARDAPASAEDAGRMVGDLVRLEAGVEAHRAALKVWFGDREPMVVGGVECGFLAPRDASFRPTATPQTIAWWLDDNGFSGAGVLSLDRSKIGKPLARQLVDAGLGEMTTGAPVFKSRKSS